MAESGADKVWVPDKEEVWKVGEVIDMSGDSKTLTVEVEDKMLQTFFNRTVNREDVLSYDPDHELDFDNAFDMGDLNEAAILSLLKRRTLDDKIYTFMGNILLSVNPYKTIKGLFEPMPKPGSLRSEKKDATPHLYVLADRVARELFDNGIRGTSQSVLINGESGAGKTVAAKQIMAFLADLSQHKRKEAEKGKGGRGGKRGYGGGYGAAASGRKRGGAAAKKDKDTVNRSRSQIEETILKSNPLLEAFGNARTIRNDNSSRFGKFVQLNYSQSQVIIGARTRHFLLEKSRIVKHGKGERNYHIFYQFCQAYQRDPQNSLFAECGEIMEPTKYSYLTPSASVKVELDEDPRRKKKKGVRAGVSAMAKRAAEFLERNKEGIRSQDLAEFDEVSNAFDSIDVDRDDQVSVYRVLACVLALGNIKFEDKPGSDADEVRCVITNDDSDVQKVADLLGVDNVDLENALCRRTVRAANRKSMTKLPLTSDEAYQSLDGLSKAIYEAVFIWLVTKINEATGAAVKASEGAASKKKNNRKTELFIGILDIFGFEILQDNSFEQLCINYANEALQGLFDTHVIHLEEAGYQEENVKITLDYRDNQPLLTLLNDKEKKVGVFQLMDEQGALGATGSDEKLLKAIHSVHGGGSGKQKRNQRFGGTDTEAKLFTVNHFAGPVEYNVIGMVGKNADHLQADLADLIAIGGMPTQQNEMSEEQKKELEEQKRMRGRKNKEEEEDEDESPEGIKETFPFLQKILRQRAKGSKMEQKPSGDAGKSKKRQRKNRKMAKLVSVSKRFREEMTQLEDLLKDCDQHFVRCIKPNDRKVTAQESMGWDTNMVSQQLKMLGALEMVKARRNGYPVRSPFETVLARYPEIMKVKEIALSDEVDARKACTKLMAAYYPDGKNKLWALGDTKCFMREQVSKQLDLEEQKIHTERLDREERVLRRQQEKERLAKQMKAIVVLQRMVRGYLAKVQYRRFLKVVVFLQANLRRKKVVKQLKLQDSAAARVQAIARGWLARKNYGRTKKIVPFQAIVRGILFRKKFSQIHRTWKKYKHLLHEGEMVVLASTLAQDKSFGARTSAGQPHALLFTSSYPGPVDPKKMEREIMEPRILYVNDQNGKLKMEIPWDYLALNCLVSNEYTLVIRSPEPTGPAMRQKWRFRFALPVAIKWQLCIHNTYTIYDLMNLGPPDENADVRAHGQVAPLDKSSDYIFGGPGVLGGEEPITRHGALDLTQKLEWRSRYVVMKGQSIYWFDEKKGFATGAMTLNPLNNAGQGRTVTTAFGPNNPAVQGLEVTSPLLSTALLLGCPTPNDRVQWNRVINSTIKKRRQERTHSRRVSVTKGITNNKAFILGEESMEAFDDRDFEAQIEQEEDIEQPV